MRKKGSEQHRRLQAILARVRKLGPHEKSWLKRRLAQNELREWEHEEIREDTVRMVARLLVAEKSLERARDTVKVALGSVGVDGITARDVLQVVPASCRSDEHWRRDIFFNGKRLGFIGALNGDNDGCLRVIINPVESGFGVSGVDIADAGSQNAVAVLTLKKGVA